MNEKRRAKLKLYTSSMKSPETEMSRDPNLSQPKEQKRKREEKKGSTAGKNCTLKKLMNT